MPITDESRKALETSDSLESYVAWLESRVKDNDALIRKLIPTTGGTGLQRMLTTLMNSTSMDTRCNISDRALAKFLDTVIAALGYMLQEEGNGAGTGETFDNIEEVLNTYDRIRSPERLEAVAEYMWRMRSSPSQIPFDKVKGNARNTFAELARAALEGDMLYRMSLVHSEEHVDLLLEEWVGAVSEDRLGGVLEELLKEDPSLSREDIAPVVEKALKANDRWYLRAEASGVKTARGGVIPDSIEVEGVAETAEQ